ncbi:MAG: OmpP1/FadL family transporter [Janthinobacterium lividum]
MKKRILWLCLALAVGQAGHAFAQGPDDALRYSRLQFGGPARTQGIAGANVALGADFGNLTSNPAGLGFYQKSEVHAGLSVGIGNSNSSLDGSGKLSDNANSVNVPSIGLVLATRRPDNDQGYWRGGAFALGFTRLADYNVASNYSGSVTDNRSFFQYLREGDPGQFANINSQFNNNQYTNIDGLAYAGYLTDQLVTKRNRNNPNAPADSIGTRNRIGNIAQGERIVSSGSLSQFDLGYGGNYRDKLYIGVGLGIVSSNYRQSRDFTEAENTASTPFVNLLLHDELHTTGTGINGRLGLIYRVANAVRLGASVQTPTFMRMTDTYSTSLNTNYTPQGQTGNTIISNVFNSTVPGAYDYTITTPFRANGGVAVVIGKYGFVTGDVEYVGYGQARINNDPNGANGDNSSFAAQNQRIQELYRNTVNFRVGAEGRFDIFRARLGFATYGDPYKTNSTGTKGAQNFYTAGLGLRQKSLFVDVAGVYTTFDRNYSPYTLNSGQEPVATVNNTRFTTSVTAGLIF